MPSTENIKCSILSRLLRYSLCGVGGFLLLFGLIVLSCIDQDDARHSFGHSGGTDFFFILTTA